MTAYKKRGLSWAFGLALLGGMVAYPLSSRTAQAERHEHNPGIHHALDALHDARAELEAAPHDYHGHKHEAMEAIDHAIEQLDRIKDW